MLFLMAVFSYAVFLFLQKVEDKVLRHSVFLSTDAVGELSLANYTGI
jgi:hypothetical protein